MTNVSWIVHLPPRPLERTTGVIAILGNHEKYHALAAVLQNTKAKQNRPIYACWLMKILR